MSPIYLLKLNQLKTHSIHNEIYILVLVRNILECYGFIVHLKLMQVYPYQIIIFDAVTSENLLSYQIARILKT